MLLSQFVTQSAFGSNVQYVTNTFFFTADDTVTTLTMTDASLTTDSVDSFLDDVVVK